VQAGVKIRPEQIGSTSCPVYMMWGLEDRSHKLSQPSSLSELVPTVKIEKLDSCGHFPNLEAIDPFIKILKQLSAQ
jgi:pimeloyl-ACP methyl ester carboxylesterase